MYTCNKCGSECKPSKALNNTLVETLDFPNSNYGDVGNTLSRTGTATLVDCMKCINCGNSFVPDKINDTKQPKEFNSKLFKAYINKFSDVDKEDMLHLIVISMGDRNREYYSNKLSTDLNMHE